MLEFIAVQTTTTLTVLIPGEPVAKGRPKFVRRGNHAAAITPQKTVRWEASARMWMKAAMDEAGIDMFTGPVRMTVEAVWPLPLGKYRKREPRQREPRTSKPDADNVLKIVGDAGNGVMFADDSQVVAASIEKWTGAQDEQPFVRIVVEEA